MIVAVGAQPRARHGRLRRPKVVGPDDLLIASALPARLTIVGAGPIGLEYASLFASLGSRVVLLEEASSFASFADGKVLDALLRAPGSHACGGVTLPVPPGSNGTRTARPSP